MPKFEFILIGVGINVHTTRGQVCQEFYPPCPRGVPTFRAHEGNDDYRKDGYKKIQGEENPEALGGLQFDDEREATEWLASADGVRFKNVFSGVYLARVIAKTQ
jgi:hypothetical protein